MKTFTDEGIRDLVASRFDPKELVKKALQRKKINGIRRYKLSEMKKYLERGRISRVTWQVSETKRTCELWV